MKIVSSMLKEWVDIPKDIDVITNQKIIEVESFSPVNTATNLVTGRVLTCEKHPNSDHLSVTTVDVGDEILDIVCGAPNVAKGQSVIVAKVGAVLPGEFKIKEATIRGQASRGMICSLQELGFDEKTVPEAYRDGIYAFDHPVEPGLDGLEAISQDGFVLELGLTPNRADLLSVLGFAYDLAAMTGQKVELPSHDVKEEGDDIALSVDIKTDGCGRYLARTIKNVTIKESPWWLKSALTAAGIRPINNVVDISNYVLLEYGTPLHMFDADKVAKDTIVVRNASTGETVRTLDGVDRTLEDNDVVITDGTRPIAIGGVMGLENTMIDDQTTNVILEAAWFDPDHIAKTAKRLNLRSDASLRFERGIDDTRVIHGLERATELLISLAGGVVSKGIARDIRRTVERPTITITKDEIDGALGTAIARETLLEYFTNYNYDVSEDAGTYRLTPPSYRNDISIKADIIEEVARIHGLENIPEIPHPMGDRGGLDTVQKTLRAIRHEAASRGLHEAVTYSLVPEDKATRHFKVGTPVSVMMPMSEDRKTLRQSLIHGLLEAASHNQARQIASTNLFEIGHVFAEGVERRHMAGLISGSLVSGGWTKDGIQAGFHVMKGLLDAIFDNVRVRFTYRPTSDHPFLHPGRQADIMLDDLKIGLIGELHPAETGHYDIRPATVFEIDLEPVLGNIPDITYTPVSKYPSITRDLSVIVKDDVLAETLMHLVRQTGGKSLVQADVFDIYRGQSIGEGMKSVAFKLVFNDPARTLGSEDVDKLVKKIVKRLGYELDATVRS